MDYIRFCHDYFAVTQIPVSFIQGRVPLFSAIGERLGIESAVPGRVFWENDYVNTNPTLCSYSPEILYGCVHIEGTDFYVVLGPVFSMSVTDAIVDLYIRENRLPEIYREDISEFLHNIPLTSQSQFQRHLSLIHRSLNNTEPHIGPDFSESLLQSEKERQRIVAEDLLSNEEDRSIHDAYDLELQLFACLREGNPEALRSFLEENTAILPEGHLASTPIRHMKNLFIQSVTKAGMLAAIPGGLEKKAVYRLMELYIQECERLHTVNEVEALLYAMLRDFCQRLGAAKLPENLSKDVSDCLSYIHAHIMEPISVNDLSSHVGKSASYLNRHFQTELGASINSCILDCKLRKAADLLQYTNRPLVDISCFLCFSSQSYFQNCFKRAYGVTPLQYRKRMQRTG